MYLKNSDDGFVPFTFTQLKNAASLCILDFWTQLQETQLSLVPCCFWNNRIIGVKKVGDKMISTIRLKL